MRRIHIICIAILLSSIADAQTLGGEIKHKPGNKGTIIKQKPRTSSRQSIMPQISVIDDNLKTCELYGANNSSCIPKSTSGKYVIPEKVNGYKVVQIGSGAFYFCTQLSDISLPKTIEVICNSAFFRCDKLKMIEIPVGVKEIRKQAFMNCYSLTRIHIPKNVQHIGSSAFSMCGKLVFIAIPEGMKEIESFTFSDSGLKAFTIPSTIERIGMWAFGHCKKLGSVTCRAIVPPSLDKNVFTDISDTAILYVPVGTKQIYEKAGWNKYFNTIVESNE
ncbi:MAG: leucine-rich repeat domain-containing protein [Prevotella sp.]|nr:leucine-rich repeat domain-containing protein [Prevotella sp.]